MKKNIIITTLTAVAAMSAFSVFAADGQINFTGEIIDSACEVVNSVSNPLTVNMGKVAKTAFTGGGSTASATMFTLQLINCPATYTDATVQFDGTSVEGNLDILALTTGGATGVGIQLTDASQNIIPLGSQSVSFPLKSTGINNLEFIARYVAVSDEVTPGAANAVGNFTINYN